MPLSRNTTLILHFLLDECLPPIVRDSRWFMWLPFRLLFGKQAEIFMTFKDRAHLLSAADFRQIYEDTAAAHLDRPTDLNARCTDEILRAVAGNVLEVGCGRGYLAGLLAQKHPVTACDMVITSAVRQQYPQVTFTEETLAGLPYADNSFDTVVCTHTLEHVLDLPRAIAELRRVARQRLIVVVPRQRPARYTFDLHLRFFPMACSVYDCFPPPPGLGKRRLENLGGDWYYQEDYEPGHEAAG